MTVEEINKLAYSGEIYDCGDLRIVKYQEKQKQKINRYNKLGSSLLALFIKQKLIKRIFGSIGKNYWIEAAFHANFAGKHVFIGDYFYANFNLTLVDDGKITIGNHVMIGPNVTLVTATHPISPKLRENNLQYNMPVTIKDGVWIGANVTVLPGVTIGKNSVIGAGSVVTKDIPDNVVAYGNPCKVHREITEKDNEVYHHNLEIQPWIKEKYLNK